MANTKPKKNGTHHISTRPTFLITTDNIKQLSFSKMSSNTYAYMLHISANYRGSCDNAQMSRLTITSLSMQRIYRPRCHSMGQKINKRLSRSASKCTKPSFLHDGVHMHAIIIKLQIPTEIRRYSKNSILTNI